MWLDKATISTYDEAAKFFVTAKNKIKGKPLRSWALLKQDGNDYVVHMKHRGGNISEIGRFKPDNTFVFTMDIPTARWFSITLSQAMQGAIPFWWNRKGTGRYQVTAIKEAVKEYSTEAMALWNRLNELSVPYKEGLTFDLATHKATNAKPDEIDTIIPDKRKEWLRAVRLFKRSFLTKAKIGIIDGIITQVAQSRAQVPRYEWLRPDWHAEGWNSMLYTAVKNNDTSIEFMTYIVSSTPYTYRGMVTNDVVENLERMFREQSISLRRRFGVFG